MQSPTGTPTWDFSPAIDLLRTLSFGTPKGNKTSPLVPPGPPGHLDPSLVLGQAEDKDLSLGNFSRIWDFLSLSHGSECGAEDRLQEEDAARVAKEVRWRDEVCGADLEDNVEIAQDASAASLRTQKCAARRARGREMAQKITSLQISSYEAGTDSADDNESDKELDRLRRSPDRRAVIQDILHRPSKNAVDLPSPPTSPSPPKESLRILRKEKPISNPFHWSASASHAGHKRNQFLPLGNLSSGQRKSKLIGRLGEYFPTEAKYLRNKGLVHPEFTPLNTSDSGVHVFVDISNIMIGFHDCLKLSRDMPISTRIKRVPMSFHSLSLVLERGRPAAKRVLVGSDKFPIIQQAKRIGYETNILERVHKVKELTPRQKKFRNGGGASGLSSGSETNTGGGAEKWVEQAVDEILHLKILESLIDAEQPSTIVLASGDAAIAEYSGGFLRMVERALAKGWVVELVSFKLNTSGAYKRKEFRSQWGPMFKWVQLDDFVEDLVDDQED